MENEESNKCAHIPCSCQVAAGQEYCGDACRNAGNEEVEVACQCDHVTCANTI
jgi:hypothetical protein